MLSSMLRVRFVLLHSFNFFVFRYMCQLSDKDLRLAGAKSTTELMYNSFKDAFDSNQYRIDLDGLTLAYKYFMCSTLTIRICGIAQMNVSLSSLPILKITLFFKNRIKLVYGASIIQLVRLQAVIVKSNVS